MSPSLFLSMIIIVAGMRNSFGRSRLIPCLRHCLNKSLICFIFMFTQNCLLKVAQFAWPRCLQLATCNENQNYFGTIPVYLADEGYCGNILQQHFPSVFHSALNLPMLLTNQPAVLYKHFQLKASTKGYEKPLDLLSSSMAIKRASVFFIYSIFDYGEFRHDLCITHLIKKGP